MRNLEYWFDYYVGYWLCNPAHLNRYHEYMIDKYGEDRYLNKKN
jgi:hypothetical protein